MSTMVNEKSIAYLQTNVARFRLGDLFAELSLEMADKAKEETRKQAAEKAELVVNGERVHLSKLADDALITYRLKIYSVDYTSHTHQDLRHLNQSIHVFDDSMRVETNESETKLERDSFNGVKLDAKVIRSLVILMLKQAQAQKSAQTWRKHSGKFQLNSGKNAKGQIIWLDYVPAKPKSVIESAIESGETLLDLGKIASAVMNVQAPMQVISADMHQTKPKAPRKPRNKK